MNVEHMSISEARERGIVPAPSQRVVILNGPRGSGKDFIAEMFSSNRSDAFHLKFSSVLKLVTSLGLGMSEKVLEGIKLDKVFGPDGDKSYVDLQIELFQWLAESYGDDVLGRFVMAEIHDTSTIALIQNPMLTRQTFIFSDGGRPSEIKWVVDHMPAKHVLLCRLHRDGHTFDGDIRSYVHLDDVPNIDLTNDGSEASAKAIVADLHEWCIRSYGAEAGLPPNEIDRIAWNNRVSIQGNAGNWQNDN